MSGIKGLVLLTRLSYVENLYGKEGLKAFLDKLNVDKDSPLFQPIIISKDYQEELLQDIDAVLLKEYFNHDMQKFLELGNWNARQLLPTYFQIYIDEKNPGGFIEQMALLRPHLVGLGEMLVSAMEPNQYLVRINYGQPYPESIRLSELGVLEEGVRLCGGKNVKTKIEEQDDTSVEYQIEWQ